jgi:hypothetical protein
MFEKIPIASRSALDDGLLIDVFRGGETTQPPPKASFPVFRVRRTATVGRCVAIVRGCTAFVCGGAVAGRSRIVVVRGRIVAVRGIIEARRGGKL